MTDPVNRPGSADPLAFIETVEHAVRRRDAMALLELYGRVTGQPPVLWGPSIVGFGAYRYRYATGRTGESAAAGFSPRKAATTLYMPDGFSDRAGLLARLGPHRSSASCLYVTNLEALDLTVLEELVRDSYAVVTASGFGDHDA